MSGICRECARRAWLLAKLGGRLDRQIERRDQSSFWYVLELPDLELIDAIAPHRRTELHAAYAEWQPAAGRRNEQPQALCRHHAVYPRSLRDDALSPHSFELRGGVTRLQGLLEEKVVAIVGTRTASDYGMEVARDLARGLAASGITVASNFAEGIPSAALAGALEADGAPLAVMSAGVERCTPAWHAPLYRRVLESGCSMAESHASSRTRRWWPYASARTLALLAQLVIVVEGNRQTLGSCLRKRRVLTRKTRRGGTRARQLARLQGHQPAAHERGATRQRTPGCAGRALRRRHLRSHRPVARRVGSPTAACKCARAGGRRTRHTGKACGKRNTL